MHYDHIHLETAQIPWRDLLRFFAQGVTLQITDNLDLVEVASAFGEDDKNKVQDWLDAKLIHTVSDQQAKIWVNEDARVWAAVVRPWVLVQENKANAHP